MLWHLGNLLRVGCRCSRSRVQLQAIVSFGLAKQNHARQLLDLGQSLWRCEMGASGACSATPETSLFALNRVVGLVNCSYLWSAKGPTKPNS